MSLDIQAIRAQFPILEQQVHGKPLVYLDNAATTQKPLAVINALDEYYRLDNSNVHRGAHALADRATQKFEHGRQVVQRFINAPTSEVVLWSRGTTESINMVAQSYGRTFLQKGDVILVTAMEHHANIVPWQMLCEEKGCILKPIPVKPDGELDMAAFDALLDNSVKFVSVVHVSNALGTVNPVAEIIQKAHAVGAKVLVDGAQAVAHFPVDVQALDCDFYVFSAHKVFGPTGLGVLYGNRELLNAMPPCQGGGEMIAKVSFAGTTYNELPYKFEAGTPHIAGVIGLAAGLEYFMSLDRIALAQHEDELLQYAMQKARAIEGITLIGEAPKKAGVMSFLMAGAHPSDVGMLLDQQGIAVRTGHHCAMPIMDQLCIPGTVRASFSIYSTKADVDALIAGLEKVKMFL